MTSKILSLSPSTITEEAFLILHSNLILTSFLDGMVLRMSFTTFSIFFLRSTFSFLFVIGQADYWSSSRVFSHSCLWYLPLGQSSLWMATEEIFRLNEVDQGEYWRWRW